jgi:hypothetical protein
MHVCGPATKHELLLNLWSGAGGDSVAVAESAVSGVDVTEWCRAVDVAHLLQPQPCQLVGAGRGAASWPDCGACLLAARCEQAARAVAVRCGCGFALWVLGLALAFWNCLA